MGVGLRLVGRAARGSVATVMLVLFLVVAFPVSLLAAAPARLRACDARWKVVASRNRGSGDNYLMGASALAPNDAWAVGASTDRNKSSHTLTEHWDGSRWRIVPSPNHGSSELRDVTAVAAGDVWAVGSRQGPNGPRLLAEHWDGVSWTIVPTPQPPGLFDFFAAASADAPDDVWAVGVALDADQVFHSVIEHWDGARWSLLRAPNRRARNSFLSGVVAASSHLAWMVGTSVNGTLVLRWDGTSLAVVGAPSPGVFADLTDVFSRASDDAWAVGYFAEDTSAQTYETLIEHWNGTKWTISQRTRFGRTDLLTGVWGLPSGEALAVGSADSGTLIERWNGAKWRRQPSPDPGLGDSLETVVADPSGQAWAMGWYTQNGIQRSLIVRSCQGPRR